VVIGSARARAGVIPPFLLRSSSAAVKPAAVKTALLAREVVLETCLAPKAVRHTGVHSICGWGLSLPSIPRVHRGSTPGSPTHTHINAYTPHTDAAYLARPPLPPPPPPPINSECVGVQRNLLQMSFINCGNVPSTRKFEYWISAARNGIIPAAARGPPSYNTRSRTVKRAHFQSDRVCYLCADILLQDESKAVPCFTYNGPPLLPVCCSACRPRRCQDRRPTHGCPCGTDKKNMEILKMQAFRKAKILQTHQLQLLDMYM
jgi:hypothetical protein